MKAVVKSILFVAISTNIYAQNASDLDVSFGVNGKVFTDFNGQEELGSSVAIQPDGKIILAGTGIVNTADGYDFCVARYNTDGSLDGSFGTNGKANFEITNFILSNKKDHATGVALQSDGKIVLVGYAPNANFSTADNNFAVVRLNSNGTLDPSYATNGLLRIGFGGLGSRANAVKIQADNKAVVVGFSKTTSANNDYAIARINTDGSLDTDFSNDGKHVVPFGTYDMATALAIQTDGKILVGGDAENQLGLVRFTAFGVLDNTFGIGGKVLTPIAGGTEKITSVAVQTNGKIVCGGTRYNNASFNFLLVQYNPNGTLDQTFGTAGITTTDIDNNSEDLATSIALQTDAKILLVGTCNTNGTDYFAINRFNNNGILDSTFSTDGIQLTAMNGTQANAVLIQNDGKIVVGGGIYLGASSAANFGLARYLGNSFLGTDNFEPSSKLKIYPNPVRSCLQIGIDNENLVGSAYQILDARGKVILEKNIVSLPCFIDVESLVEGAYVLKIKNLAKKFIKE